MTKRTKDWNEELAKDLRDIEFAREFIIAIMEEGLPLREILGKIIRAYGVKEFSKKVNIPSSNIIRALNSKNNPTEDTLNKLLKPFGLQLAVAPIKKQLKRKVA
jgi:DNA-binding phage protein